MFGKKLATTVVLLLAIILVVQLVGYLVAGLVIGGERAGVGFYMFIGEFVLGGGASVLILYLGSLRKGEGNKFLAFSMYFPAYLGVITSIILSWVSFIFTIPAIPIIAASIAIIIDIVCAVKCYKILFVKILTENIQNEIAAKNADMRAVKIEAGILVSLCKNTDVQAQFNAFLEKINGSPLSSPPEVMSLNNDLISIIKQMEDDLSENKVDQAIEKLGKANIIVDRRNLTIKNIRGKIT